MKCVICRHGETRPGRVAVTLAREGMALVIRGVPADVCENCGERYVQDETSRNLMVVAEDALRDGVKLDVREYRAA